MAVVYPRHEALRKLLTHLIDNLEFTRVEVRTVAPVNERITSTLMLDIAGDTGRRLLADLARELARPLDDFDPAFRD